jgi:dihydroorotase
MLDGHGTPLEVGQPAQITLYDQNITGTFTRSDLRGRSENSPYLGRELPGRVEWTIHNGRVTLEAGTVVEELNS